jgi:hypothetical protein
LEGWVEYLRVWTRSAFVEAVLTLLLLDNETIALVDWRASALVDADVEHMARRTPVDLLILKYTMIVKGHNSSFDLIRL